MEIFTSLESNLNKYILPVGEKGEQKYQGSITQKNKKLFTAHKLQFTQNSTTCFRIELTQA